MDKDSLVGGLSLEMWKAIFRPGIPEFASTCFMFTREAKDFVRIAFGNNGPVVSLDGTRAPVFTHAVTLTPEMAVDLAGMLLKFYAEPAGDKSRSSGEL